VKLPLEDVFCVFLSFVALLIAVTEAAAITAPEGSVTVPLMLI
jgi:hypothetical protein